MDKEVDNKIKYYPLTHPQKTIWLTEKMYPNTSIGNVAGTLRIKGEIDYSLLEKAINIFIEKNDGMRLRIVEKDGMPLQYVSENKHKEFDYYDFSSSSVEELYKWDEHQTRIPFNIIDCDLFYFALVKINENDGGFYIKTHHLISDAWSMTLIGNQIIEHYSALKNGQHIDTNKNNSYIEYIQSEEEYKNSDRFIKDKEYWNNLFKDIQELTILKPRNKNYSNTKAKRKTFIVPTRLTKKLHQYCRQNKATIASLFLAGISLYINRVTSKEDLVIGTMVLNRINHKEKDTIGMFISTAPIRVNVSNNIKFDSFVQELSGEWMNLLRHQKYPYDILQKEIREKHKIADNLYDILISYQNAKFNKKEHSEEYDTRWHFNGCQTESLAININDREAEGDLIVDYDFQSDLFNVKEIEFIHDHILRIIWHALDNPSKSISKLHMLSEKEYNKILFEFNNTQVDYPKEKTIKEIFEEQVEKTPEDIAIFFEGQQLTYRELNKRANSLARVLKNKGVKSESIVGIMVTRSLEMVIGILGILKAGGAYLPIDPEYPNERIIYMLEDSKTNILLTQHILKEEISFNGEFIEVDDEKLYLCEDSNLESISKPNDLAYIIYTSGSTGKPKGVMVGQNSVINLWNWFGQKYSLDRNKNVINLTTFTFDVSVEEIIISLLYGATIFIPKKETILSKSELNKYMNQNNINIAQFVPSLLKEILLGSLKIPTLNVVICGGESLEQQLNEDIVSIGYNLYNHYGPTEITVDALATKCCKDKVTLGKPINNCKCYILDKNLNPLPIGIAGELYISGDGLARGYLNRLDLTKKAFVDNPFEPGKKMYKTGDIARWYPQGDIEYLGRADEQVKIRGHRIELNEINKKLLTFKGIKEAIVIDKTDKNNKKYLCAFIVSNTVIIKAELKEYLSKELADYMIPSHFVFIDKLPLTPNGKIGINLLREMEIPFNNRTEYIPPRDKMEEELSKIWYEVLGIEQISINDDFFELGGDSLSVINMVSKIEKLTNKQIQVSSVYENRTISKIAQLIKNEKTNKILKEITLLRRGKSNKNIFFIHGGSGSIGGYSNIFRSNNMLLDERFNCYAIKFDKLNGYNPTKVTIEELAQEYAERILTIQHDGEYYLAAWCIGGQIIFEIAAILEKKFNKKVKSVIMFNSFAPKEWDIYYTFEFNSEVEFIKEILGDKIDYNSIRELHDVEVLWQYIIESIKNRGEEIKKVIPRDILYSIPNHQTLDILDIIYYINVMRSLHNARVDYWPENKLSAQLYYFKPMKDTTIDNHEENVFRWQSYCDKKIKMIEIDADEHSIFDEDINQTIKLLNEIL